MPQSSSVEEYTWFACHCMTACLGFMFLAHVHPHHLPKSSIGSAVRIHLFWTCWLVSTVSSFKCVGVPAVSCPALWGGRRLLVKGVCCDHRACACLQKSQAANLNTEAHSYAVRTTRAVVGFVKQNVDILLPVNSSLGCILKMMNLRAFFIC